MDKSSAQQAAGKYFRSVISTNVAAAALAVLIGVLCFKVSQSPQEQVFNALLAILGALIGWALGMFFAPYNPAEAARFSSIAQGISVFVSGYALSKLDRFLEATMFTTTEGANGTVDTPSTITWIRVGLFTCSVLLVMLTVFTNRAYFDPEEALKEAKPEAETESGKEAGKKEAANDAAPATAEAAPAAEDALAADQPARSPATAVIVRTEVNTEASV